MNYLASLKCKNEHSASRYGQDLLDLQVIFTFVMLMKSLRIMNESVPLMDWRRYHQHLDQLKKCIDKRTLDEGLQLSIKLSESFPHSRQVS